MRKLSNTEAELKKKTLLIKKMRVIFWLSGFLWEIWLWFRIFNSVFATLLNISYSSLFSSSEVDSLITGVVNFFLQFWTSHACWFLPSLFPPFPSILVSFVGPRSLCVFVSLFLVTLLRLGFFSFNSPDGN